MVQWIHLNQKDLVHVLKENLEDILNVIKILHSVDKPELKEILSFFKIKCP